MKIYGFVFARGGSKGLLNKNIRLLKGKPLIGWAIQHLKACQVDRIIVSTDSLDIATIAREYGAEVPFMRPNYLATDNCPEIMSWKHVLEFIQSTEGQLPDVMVSVPTTSPLRLTKDIIGCINLFKDKKADLVVTMTKSLRSPYFNMVKRTNDCNVELICKDIQGETFVRRQDTPETFDLTTVAYVASPEYILKAKTLFEGHIVGYEIPKERSIDIDDIYDFQIAEHLMELHRD